MRRNDSEAPSSARHGARERRRNFKRLRPHRQFVLLLVLVTLLSTAGIASVAYVGSRSAAISNAQASASQDALVLRDELIARGAPLLLSDGRFVVGADAATTLTLNNDTSVVDHTRAMLSADTTIYELESSRLVAISTTIPAAGSRSTSVAPSPRDLGDTLSATITSTVLGSCGSGAPSTCYHAYNGVAALAGRQYVVGVVPLFDATGAFVGAVSAALPLDTILAPTVQLVVMLLLVGALLALISLASGTWIYGARVESVLDLLDSRLNRLADAAGDLEHLAYHQVDHSSRQSSVARQIAEQVRALAAMAQVMEQGHATLRDSTTAMWAEVSQPGMALDAALAARLAQQTAVAAARVGSAAEDSHNLCRQLVTQMNHVAAEAGIVTEGGLALEQRARDLRACVEGVEMTLGERLRERMAGSSLPFVGRVRGASQRLRWFLPGRPGGAIVDQSSATRGESVQHQQPESSSRGVQCGTTSHHIAARRPSGTLRPGSQWSTYSNELPSISRDAVRGDPAASLPRPSHYPDDTASSGDAWDPNRSQTSGWPDA
ncbi:MAG TPA: cache domain-containing protein [Ktedonobacterales bacterium]|nr:cache domain-containing protein [Ktedonobacterales bacterium]